MSSYTNRSIQLLHETLVWDNHLCLPMDLEKNLIALNGLEQVRNSGVDVVSINIGYANYDAEHQFTLIHQMRNWIQQNQDRFALPDSVNEIKNAKSMGKLSIVFDIEGAQVIESNLDRIARFYELGVRWMLLVYNKNSLVGGGCHDNDLGITALGRDVVKKMAEVGMAVCCSHAGYRTARDVLEINPNPTLFSHSNPYALVKHPRNIPDDLIKACAENGGVIGISGVNVFLGNPTAKPENMAVHIDYVAQLVGVEHVGFSLDYFIGSNSLKSELASMPDYFPEGNDYENIQILSPKYLASLTNELFVRGYNSIDIENILGGNFLRIAEHVWR